jgi:TonB family protein
MPGKPYPGRSHSCELFYPPSAILNNIEGRTLMAFTVTADGRVADPMVKTSSGDADLDDAATRCVLRWNYRAALKDGVAVAVPWQAYVQWKQTFHLKVVSAPHCNLPPQARTQKPGTKTEISLIVNTDGVPGNINIIHTSDDSMLDKAVTDCVASSRFEPYRGSDGKPVDYPTSETIVWTPPD